MSNEYNNDQDGGNVPQKTLVPDKTLNNTPDPGATIIGRADTVEDPMGLQPKVNASSKTVNAKPEQVGDINQPSIHTLVSSPDADPTAFDSSVEPVSEHPTLDMDTPVPDQTLIVQMDGGGATFIGTPDQPGGRQDLEDHFETLIEDANNPGTTPQSPGGFVIGDYQVLQELGRGGMGVVYKARHRKLNREVALKMILAGPHAGKEALERFIGEARAVAHLQHPGIVQIFDIGEHEGLPFFSLEYVEGCDLKHKLDGKPQSAKDAAALVEKLCTAMQYAHDNNILHRDIKPPNVLIDRNGEPKITDFGLAKHVDPEEASTGTQAGTIMGSPSYMPPEQARGEISSVTPRSDLYSLGAVLYEMLTGRPPFLASRPLETVMQVVNNEPVAPKQLQPGIPVDLETICLKALQKDQAARYGSCQEFAEDLRRFINDEPILARPISKAERLLKWCKRNPRVAVPTALASFFVLATALISTWAWSATSAQAAIITQEKANVEKERDEAERQKVLANEAQLQAEKNEALAEKQALLALSNMQLIITEVDDRLARQPGMADLRIGILTVVEKKWDELDVELAGGIRGQAIPTQMAVRAKIAAAWASLDRLAEADANYSRIYEQAQERLIVKDRNDASRYNLATICFSWAPIKQRLTGDPAESEKLLQEGLALLREMISHPLPSLDPKSPSPSKFQVAATLQSTLMQLASARKKQGDPAGAESAFKEVGEVSTDILKDITDRIEWVTSLPEGREAIIQSHFAQNLDLAQSGRANVLCSLNRVDEAIPLFLAAIQSRRDGFAANPTDRNSQFQLALQLLNYGQYMTKAKRFQDGAAAIAEAHSNMEACYESDPTNANFKRVFAAALYYLAVARDAIEANASDSIAFLERARVLRTELLETSDDQSNKVNLMLPEARLGNSDAALALIDDLAKSEAKDPDLRLDLARALAQLSRSAEGEARDKLITRAIEAVERCVADGLSHSYSLKSEVDLAPIQADLRFKGIVAQLEETQIASGESP